MDKAASILSMSEQNRQISAVVEGERSRLLRFARRRIPDPSEAEDILQERCGGRWAPSSERKEPA